MVLLNVTTKRPETPEGELERSEKMPTDGADGVEVTAAVGAMVGGTEVGTTVPGVVEVAAVVGCAVVCCCTPTFATALAW